MPEDMPDRMPEDMPDIMPEDLPATKRINVMVGITRSKVFFLPFRLMRLFVLCLYPGGVGTACSSIRLMLSYNI